jgi:hypothetical protein
MITSQGGSVEWRFTQNPTGHDYGHHMSKVTEMPHSITLMCPFTKYTCINHFTYVQSAANMMGVLLSQEMKAKGLDSRVFPLMPVCCILLLSVVMV